MNPDTNKLEILREVGLGEKIGSALDCVPGLVRPDGSPVPKTWSIFTEGEEIIVKDYRFTVVYFNAETIVLEPAGPILLKGESQ
jgi:hypothetical protein